MKKIAVSTLGIVLIAAQPVLADIYKGKWFGVTDASLEILPDHSVTYCYLSDCATVQYSGNAKRKIRFHIGTSNYVFVKTEQGYHGTYSDPDAETVEIDMK